MAREQSATQKAELSTLPFAASTSKTVGLHGPAIDRLKENAPRVVGVGKVTADVMALSAGAIAGSASFGLGMGFSLISRYVLMRYGGKHDHHAKAEESPEKHKPHGFVERAADNASKIFHPDEHPVEAASAWALLGGLAIGVSGLFLATGGLQAILIGSLITVSEGGVVFGKSKKEKDEEKAHTKEHEKDEKKEQPSLRFAESKSRSQGLTGKAGEAIKAFKETPEVRAGILQAASSLLQISLGISWLAVSPVAGALAIGAGGLYVVSSLFYSAFVRRDGPDEKEKQEPDKKAVPPPEQKKSFTERLLAERQEQNLQPSTGRNI